MGEQNKHYKTFRRFICPVYMGRHKYFLMIIPFWLDQTNTSFCCCPHNLTVFWTSRNIQCWHHITFFFLSKLSLTSNFSFEPCYSLVCWSPILSSPIPLDAHRLRQAVKGKKCGALIYITSIFTSRQNIKQQRRCVGGTYKHPTEIYWPLWKKKVVGHQTLSENSVYLDWMWSVPAFLVGRFNLHPAFSSFLPPCPSLWAPRQLFTFVRSKNFGLSFKTLCHWEEKNAMCWDMSNVMGRKGSWQLVRPLANHYKHRSQTFSTPLYLDHLLCL